MKILSIETSCDETAVSIVECTGELESPDFRVLGNALYSQASKHAEFGGVYPNLAKRLHGQNLLPMLKEALKEAEMLHRNQELEIRIQEKKIREVLEREAGLAEELIAFLSHTEVPDIDAIAVTQGPGLEPALWVGLNFAKALALAWEKPLIPVNHMEGHIVSVLYQNKDSKSKAQNQNVQFPLLALLVSGGHTELVLAREWGKYELLGHTRDDAAGEAFDKVARILELPYPGGPHISKLAKEARELDIKPYDLPRPMIDSGDYDFSFSGLKTAVLYTMRNVGEASITSRDKHALARGFEEAVTDVLLSKTKQALKEYSPHTLIMGGGVVANKYIRSQFEELIEEFAFISLLYPSIELTGDNAVMIAIAGYIKYMQKRPLEDPQDLRAHGNQSIESN